MLIFDSLDWEVNAVNIDVLHPFLGGVSANQQFFEILVLDDPSKLRVGVEFVADIFDDSLEAVNCK